MYSIQVNDLSNSVITINEQEVVIESFALKPKYPKMPLYGPCADLENTNHLNSTLNSVYSVS